MIIAIIAVIMAAVAPSLAQSNDVERVTDAADKLKLVSNAVDSFAKYVRRGPGVTGGKHFVPASLTHLDEVMPSVGSSGCASWPYNTNGQNGWVANGPFTPIYMPSNGLWTSIGRINDSYATLTASAATFYDLTIPSVSTQDAELLDQIVDGNQNSAADTVRYTPPSGGTVTLTYRVFFGAFTAC
jgi:type II secretory pathway pseudopilin PulG